AGIRVFHVTGVQTCALPIFARGVHVTVVPVLGHFTLRAGSELVMDITRDDRRWTTTIAAGDRGTWLTSYGVGIVPNRNDRVFLRSEERRVGKAWRRRGWADH